MFEFNMKCLILCTSTDTRQFECQGSREVLNLTAICNGTAECEDGMDELNPLCAGLLTRMHDRRETLAS